MLACLYPRISEILPFTARIMPLFHPSRGAREGGGNLHQLRLQSRSRLLLCVDNHDCATRATARHRSREHERASRACSGGSLLSQSPHDRVDPYGFDLALLGESSTM